MSKKGIKYLFIGFLLVGLFEGCSLKKGFEALQIYNYFEAKKQFEKNIGKKKQSPAAYGLSVIYYRDDNPFHNMDSAYRLGNLSVYSFDDVKEKTQEKWKEKLGYSLKKAESHRKKIANWAFQQAVDTNTVEGFDAFRTAYQWSDLLPIAIRKRDSLAFLNTKMIDSAVAYAQYIQKYPNSLWIPSARNKLDQAQYRETVVKGNPQSYLHFIKKFPNNPFKRDAYYQIYLIENKGNNIQSYANFVKKYPKSPFVNDAWKQLYRLSIADYSKLAIINFQESYPQFPFPKIIQKDLQLAGQQLLPFYQDGKYGYIDLTGKVVLPPTFEFAKEFKDGLAIVQKEGKYGFINKEGKLLIDYRYDNAFDFSEGRAVVELNGKYGLIDVTGNYVLAPQFEDIGPFSDGLAYVQSDTGYQYYTLEGSIAFSSVFDEAFTFKNGLAHVKIGTKDGYIAPDGSFVVSVNKGEIRRFSTSVFVHEFSDSACFVYPFDTVKTARCFQHIGVLKNNRAIVSLDGQYGYADASGQLVVPITRDEFPNYLQLGEYQNDYALVYRRDKYGLIDTLGKRFYPAIFKNIGLHGKLTPVTKGRGWGYANDDVQLKIDYQFDYAGSFIDGIALVENDELYGVIDLKGETIVPLEFASIQRLKKNLLRVEKEGKFGIVNYKGEVIVPLNYSKIVPISDTIYRLIGTDSINYYDISQHELIVPHE